MCRWHHRFNGHESEQVPGDGERQWSLMCCSPQGHKMLGTTESLNNKQTTSCKMPSWMKHKLESRLPGKISTIRCAGDTTLMAEREKEWKSLLMKVKEETKNAGLNLNIQKTKSMASCPIISWEIYGQMWKQVSNFIFLGSKITLGGDCTHKIKRHLLLWRMKVLVTQLCVTLCGPITCTCNSPDKNTGMGCHSLLQGIFLIQGSDLGLLHCMQILYHLNYQGSLRKIAMTHLVKWKSLSHVRIFATPWTIVHGDSPGQNTGVGSLSLLQGWQT